MAPITYSVEELVDMDFLYGLADENSLLASRLYAEPYPNKNLPHHQMFVRVFQRFRETGSVKFKETRKRANVRPVQLDEAILERMEEDPTNSTRRISVVENTKALFGEFLKSSLHTPFTIKNCKLYPKETVKPEQLFVVGLYL
ncbi:Helix-turn-helix domain (DUF4817) [Popillia japonica]|uniref:Helix-turn-helix domain (DUF4817) n=1 Tax=Popillia japonica TaxID=7064 RepID=A0AAW1KR13_POPJA